MIIIPLEQSPICVKPQPNNPNTKKLKNSAVVFTRKGSRKATLQIRMHFQTGPSAETDMFSEIVNVHLTGDEAAKIADALVRR